MISSIWVSTLCFPCFVANVSVFGFGERVTVFESTPLRLELVSHCFHNCRDAYKAHIMWTTLVLGLTTLRTLAVSRGRDVLGLLAFELGLGFSLGFRAYGATYSALACMLARERSLNPSNRKHKVMGSPTPPPILLPLGSPLTNLNSLLC